MFNTFEVRKIVSESEIIKTHELLKTCGQFMYEQLGMIHWYPVMSFDSFHAIAKEKDLYAVLDEENIIATFNLSRTPRKYYYDALWLAPHAKANYLGQLAINPTMQGKGMGKWCMQLIEKITLESGLNTLRFDAVNLHPWLNNFYEKLGYQSRGIVKPGQWELMCYEKLIGLTP